MQVLARSRAQPFTAARSAHARPSVRPVVVQQRAQLVAVRAAASYAADLEDYTADLDSPQEALASTEDVKLRIRMRGYDKHLLGEAVEQVRAIAGVTGAAFKGPVMLPTKRRIYCVLRSPHVNKDAREHFEIRTHHRLVDLQGLSAQTVEAMMQWVPPPGLEVECSIV